MSHYNNNYYYYNYYSYNNYLNDPRDYYPDVARLPYSYLIYISNETQLRINPAVFYPYSNNRYYKVNCHAKFRCSCQNKWTSNKVIIELWWKWKKGKKEFDVRMYGQQCKYCNSNFKKPYVTYNNIYIILDKFIEVLLSNNNERSRNYNNNFNKVNSAHKKDKCQKCIMFGNY